MKKIKVIISVILCAVMLFTFVNVAFATDNYITVNGKVYSGSLSDAIKSAGKGGNVGIYGNVTTKPVGYTDGTYVTEVTIEGMTADAEISLPSSFGIDLSDKNLDTLTIKGSNVTLKNFTVDACDKIDFAIRIFNGSSHVILENVVAERGNRGAVNILSANDIQCIGVSANDSVQGGFYFDAIWDASNVYFSNCSTKNNSRTGVLVRNGYGDVLNLDLSGITSYENTFAVEDRMSGTIGGDSRAEISIKKPPMNSYGSPIDTSKAMYYNVEKAYQHIRFGISSDETDAAGASIQTSRYGFETTIYYGTASQANNDVREGETVTKYSAIAVLFKKIALFFKKLFSLFGG